MSSLTCRGESKAMTAHQLEIKLDPPNRTQMKYVGRKCCPAEELQERLEQLMLRMRIAVVYGGDKSVQDAVINCTRNPRAWKSYRSVAEDIAEALGRIGCRHVDIVPDDMRLGDRLRRDGTDLVWLNTGGVQGSSPMSHAPAMLEMFGVPYVGHDPLKVAILDDKVQLKRNVVGFGLPTAPFVLVPVSDDQYSPVADPRFKRAFGDYRGPFVVKPVSGRASLHVTVVDDAAGLPEAVSRIHRVTTNDAMIETYLPGREYCIAIGGRVSARGGRLTRHDEPFAFGALERLFDPDEQIVTSMDVQPITKDRVRVLDRRTDAEVLERLEHLARELFSELTLESLIRLDVRADADGRLNILEANPKPDLKAPTENSASLIAHSLGKCGMSYDDLILSLLADRIGLLFSQRPNSVRHLEVLLGQSCSK